VGVGKAGRKASFPGWTEVNFSYLQCCRFFKYRAIEARSSTSRFGEATRDEVA
jgi:hypothetical protein